MKLGSNPDVGLRRLVFFVVVVSAFSVRPVLSEESSQRPFVRVIPERRPEFRAVLPEAEYRTRLEAALAKLGDWSALKTSHLPGLGQEVVGVFPDSPAARNKVQVGDIITRRDGTPVRGDILPRTEDSRDVEFYSKSTDQVRTLRLGNESFGVNLHPWWRPELLYLHGSQMDPRWDSAVLAAAATRWTDPDLAETALQHAVAGGYKVDALSDQLGAELALCQSRYDAAAAYAWFAEQAWKAGSEEVAPLLLLRIALATGHLDAGYQIVSAAPEQFDALHPAAFPFLLESHAARPDAVRNRPAPSVQAADMFRDDLRQRLRGSTDYSIGEIMRKIHAAEPFPLAAPTAHFHTVSFEAPGLVPDFDFSVRISGGPTTRTLDHYLKWMTVGVERVEPADGIPFNQRPSLIRVGITEHGDVQLTFGPGGKVVLPDPSVTERKDVPQEVRIIRVGGAAEVYLNGHRLYYGPVDDSAPMVRFSINVTGMTSTVSSVDVAELIERALAR